MRQSRHPAYHLTPEPGKPFRASDDSVYIRPEKGGPIRRLSGKPIRSRRQHIKAVRREKFIQALAVKLGWGKPKD